MSLDRLPGESDERSVEVARTSLTPAQQRLMHAAENALPKDQLEAVLEQSRESAASSAAGHPQLDDDPQLPLDHPSVATFTTPEEMGEALEATGAFSPEVLSEIVEHERAHYDRAVALGLDATLAVAVTVDEDGNLGYQPFVSAEPSEQTLEDDPLVYREKLLQVCRAPEEPSTHDEEIAASQEEGIEAELERREEAMRSHVPEDGAASEAITPSMVEESQRDVERQIEELRAAIAQHDLETMERLTSKQAPEELRRAA